MGLSEKEVNDAYQEVFGRDADPSGLREFRKYGSADKVKRLLAESSEGRSRGVNPGSFGSTVVDPSTLSARDRGFYDVASQFGAVYSDTLSLWSRHGAAPSHMRAFLSGAIRTESVEQSDGSFVDVELFSQEAIDIMGDDLRLMKGSDKGDVVIMPEGTVPGFSRWQSVDAPEGMQAYVAKGGRSKGLAGSLGIDKLIPEELYAVGDAFTLDLFSPIVGGEKGVEASRSAKGRDLSRYTDVAAQAGRVAAVAVASLGSPLTGAAVAGGIRAADAYGRHERGMDVDWADVGRDIALDTAGAFIGGIPGQSAFAAARTLATGGDLGDAAFAAGVSAAGGVAGLAGGRVGQFAPVALNVAASYARDPDSLENALIQSAGSLAAQGVAGRSRMRPVASGAEFKDRVRRYTDLGNRDNWLKPQAQRLLGMERETGAHDMFGADGSFRMVEAAGKALDPVQQERWLRASELEPSAKSYDPATIAGAALLAVSGMVVRQQRLDRQSKSTGRSTSRPASPSPAPAYLPPAYPAPAASTGGGAVDRGRYTNYN